VERSDGSSLKLEEYKGKVLLIVNTASKCGFTKQYGSLQSLYSNYHSEGLEILAFPCNQFGAQEPDENEAIQYFCQLNFATEFEVFAKLDVKGPSVHPLFAYLAEEKKGIFGTSAIKWNFTKWLVDRQGKIVSRYAPRVDPTKMEDELKNLISKAV